MKKEQIALTASILSIIFISVTLFSSIMCVGSSGPCTLWGAISFILTPFAIIIGLNFGIKSKQKGIQIASIIMSSLTAIIFILLVHSMITYRPYNMEEFKEKACESMQGQCMTTCENEYQLTYPPGDVSCDTNENCCIPISPTQ